MHSSENIALGLLEKLGYRVIASHYKVVEEGVEIGEIDIVAEKDDELYAVEVKAGKADVSSIRQAYVNAKLIDAKPLIIARGFADESAQRLAQKLGVELIPFSEYIITDTEELDTIIRNSLIQSLEHLLDIIFSDIKIKPEEYELVKTIAETNNIVDAAKKLGLSIRDLAKKLKELRDKGTIPKWAHDYRTIRLLFKSYLYRYRIEALLNELSKLVEELKKSTEIYGGSTP